MSEFSIIVIISVTFLVIILFKTARIVPQRQEFLVERLGKFSRTLSAGLHLLIPFLDVVRYKRTLKEEVFEVTKQNCITKDNVALGIDGVLYLQVINSKFSCYGIDDYRIAAQNLAQTSLRSVIGKMDLDKTFEERERINQAVVAAVDEAAQNWGIKVLRYEVKDIEVSPEILNAMEKQMTAERDKRAAIAQSEGERQSKINLAQGEKEQSILTSEGQKQELINNAEGTAAEIKLKADATAGAITVVAEALNKKGGEQAANLEVAKQYVKEFGNLAKVNNTLIIPSDVSNISSMVATAMSVIDKTRKQNK
jgi:regulator of protease activity HflC (stomatin/prohibitin superfamily)